MKRLLSMTGALCMCTSMTACATPTIVEKQLIAQVSSAGKHNQVIEKEKLLSYQLRHNYNLYCKSGNYAVTDYYPDKDNINIVLVSNQQINIKDVCVVEGQIDLPKQIKYVYK